MRRALPVHVDLAQGVPSGLPGGEHSRRHVLSEGRQGFAHGLVFDDHPGGGIGLGPDQNRLHLDKRGAGAAVTPPWKARRAQSRLARVAFNLFRTADATPASLSRAA